MVDKRGEKDTTIPLAETHFQYLHLVFPTAPDSSNRERVDGVDSLPSVIGFRSPETKA